MAVARVGRGGGDEADGSWAVLVEEVPPLSSVVGLAALLQAGELWERIASFLPASALGCLACAASRLSSIFRRRAARSRARSFRSCARPSSTFESSLFAKSFTWFASLSISRMLS